jgi:hypothetical protein
MRGCGTSFFLSFSGGLSPPFFSEAATVALSFFCEGGGFTDLVDFVFTEAAAPEAAAGVLPPSANNPPMIETVIKDWVIITKPKNSCARQKKTDDLQQGIPSFIP